MLYEVITDMRKIVNTKSAPEPIGPYNQAVVFSGTFVFTAGQIALDPATGKIDGDDIATQTRRALTNLGGILEAAGSSFDRVVKTTVFLKDVITSYSIHYTKLYDICQHHRYEPFKYIRQQNHESVFFP